MDSMEKSNPEEEFEPVEQNVSTEEEKGSGKGKLPENKLTTAAVSFQKAIVDSALTRTPTNSETLQIQISDNLIEKNDSQENEQVIKAQDNLDVIDQQTHLSKDVIIFEGTDNIDKENTTKWESQNLQEEEMLVVVVEECPANDEQLQLQIEEETISAASTPNAQGKKMI